MFVRHFDSDCVFSRNRCHDPDTGYSQGDRQIVCQVGDLCQPQALGELDFVLRDHLSGFDLDDLDVEAEVLERLFQQFRIATDFFLMVFVTEFLRLQQQVEWRQFIVKAGTRLLFVGRFELVDDLVALGLLAGLLDA